MNFRGDEDSSSRVEFSVHEKFHGVFPERRLLNFGLSNRYFPRALTGLNRVRALASSGVCRVLRFNQVESYEFDFGVYV